MVKKFIQILYLFIVVSLGCASILERSHGSRFVQTHIYGSCWMIALWSLLTAFGIFYIIKCGIRRASMLTLHFSFAIILVGALFTHLTSKSGIVHLRKGEQTQTYLYEDTEGRRTEKPLPFSVRLDDFMIKRHAGTEAAEDFISELTVLDDHDSVQSVVSMNHIFSYKNIRLYQSSYDEDGQGSFLSLNSDPIGIPITYTGYALLFIGLIWMLVDPKGKYRQIIRNGM